MASIGEALYSPGDGYTQGAFLEIASSDLPRTQDSIYNKVGDVPDGEPVVVKIKYGTGGGGSSSTVSLTGLYNADRDSWIYALPKNESAEISITYADEPVEGEDYESYTTYTFDLTPIKFGNPGDEFWATCIGNTVTAMSGDSSLWSYTLDYQVGDLGTEIKSIAVDGEAVYIVWETVTDNDNDTSKRVGVAKIQYGALQWNETIKCSPYPVVRIHKGDWISVFGGNFMWASGDYWYYYDSYDVWRITTPTDAGYSATLQVSPDSWNPYLSQLELDGDPRWDIDVFDFSKIAVTVWADYEGEEYNGFVYAVGDVTAAYRDSKNTLLFTEPAQAEFITYLTGTNYTNGEPTTEITDATAKRYIIDYDKEEALHFEYINVAPKNNTANLLSKEITDIELFINAKGGYSDSNIKLFFSEDGTFYALNSRRIQQQDGTWNESTVIKTQFNFAGAILSQDEYDTDDIIITDDSVKKKEIVDGEIIWADLIKKNNAFNVIKDTVTSTEYIELIEQCIDSGIYLLEIYFQTGGIAYWTATEDFDWNLINQDDEGDSKIIDMMLYFLSLSGKEVDVEGEWFDITLSSETPVIQSLGDMWIDIDDNYTIYIYDGTNWIADTIGAYYKEALLSNTTFEGIPASSISGDGATEIRVIRPPSANTAFTGISSGLSISGYKVIIPPVSAYTAFTGGDGVRAIEVIGSIAGVDAANTAFTGIADGVTASDAIGSAAADTAFIGINPASFNYDKLIVTPPPANTDFKGGNYPFPYIYFVPRLVYGISIIGQSANATFIGLTPSSIDYHCLILPATAVANTSFTGSEIAHYGTPREIILTPSAAVDFPTLQCVLRDILLSPISNTEFTGVSDTIASVYMYKLESISDGFLAYDNSSSGWILPVAEVLSAADIERVQKLFNISEYGSMGEVLSAKWDGSLSLSDIILLVETADIIKFFSDVIEETLTSSDSLSIQNMLIVNEYLKFRCSLLSGASFSTAVSDSLSVVDSAIGSWLETIAESLASTDSASLQAHIFIKEYCKIVPVLNSLSSYSKSIADGLAAVDSSVAGWLISIADSINAGDEFEFKKICQIIELLSVSDNLIKNRKSSIQLSDALAYTETILENWLLSINEELGITGVSYAVTSIKEEIGDSISCLELLNCLGLFNLAVSDEITINELVYVLNSLTLQDAFSVSDTITIFNLYSGIISDQISAVDSLSPQLKSFILLNENIESAFSLSSTSKFSTTIYEALQTSIFIEVDNEIYECYVLNTSGFHPSVYTNFNFNSYCTFRNRAFAANSTGVFELTGDTDDRADIKTGFISHETDFGLPQRKRFRKAYVDISGNEPVMIMESDGLRKVYQIDDRGRFTASRDIVGRRWTLSAANFDYIESAVLVPVILSRGN